MLQCVRKVFSPATIFIRHFQVTILGAANEIGQTVTLLLRGQPVVTKLVIHDYLPETSGVLLDASHVPSESAISGYTGEETLDRALKDSDLVIVTGGVAFCPSNTKKSCFTANTNYIQRTVARIAKTSPLPFVGIVTEPINSIVPMAAEVMRHHGYYDPKKLFGITGIDLLRTQCLYAMENQVSPRNCFVPVIGGHSNHTTIPLLSQAKPTFTIDERKAQDFTAKIRKGTELVTTAKRGWSPTLSVAYSVLLFVRGVLHALEGHPSKVHAYVENNDFGTSFFSGIVNVTKSGVGAMQRYQKMSKYECHLLEESIDELRRDISKGKKTLEVTSIDLV